ncbi:mediator of RNA polymerase II transcription subunit 20 isoform 1-T1 [Guaruba guarouba]
MGVTCVSQVPVAEGKSVQQTVELLTRKLEVLGAEKQGTFCVDCETYHTAASTIGTQDGEADVRDAQLRVPPQLLRALRERPLPHRGCQLRHPHGEAQRLLPERQSQQDRDQGHPLPVLRLPGEGGHGHHGPQCPWDIGGGGVLPLCDSQRLLEPAHGVHAELHGEPRSRPPLRVQHQARQHLQPVRHHGAVHGAVQQDPQAAAGTCGRDEVKGSPGACFGMTASSFPRDQDPPKGSTGGSPRCCVSSRSLFPCFRAKVWNCLRVSWPPSWF